MSLAPRTERVPRGYYYSFAQNEHDVLDSLALRHRVFVEEMGARIEPGPAGIETDALDEYCLHLIVRERATDRAIASTRILTHEAAIAAGGFYSAAEFDIDRILATPGRFLEIGRTCVDAAHRSGGAIAVLWNGLADLIRADDYDHLIGCASIDLRDGLDRAHAICRDILARQPVSATSRVAPKRALPAASNRLARAVRLPPLIKAYLRLGARVGGPPCYDPDFGVADVFMHVDVARLSPRYARHFLGTVRTPEDEELRLTA
ncbi:GNAT family N-acetyltransferase [Salinisphaera hydrothermalis]|uniref:L-ornithine N(alpha)-acyltransferase n=1 Tax=Salinisphaera hydrothermalis (strain C41B8) TaxID=1304275 RepID=A0A084IRR2_SALHC|nr:GNAT family N-acyltransferase [Salinisphaera hydrothermalis]KEZ79396.1 hemolysin [Salinisphaera hydrothermalis C41B8]